MTNAFMKSDSIPHCKRCGRSFSPVDKDANLWNADFVAGALKGYVCPRCQTVEESLGAEIDSVELESSQLVDAPAINEMSSDEFEDLVMTVIESGCRAIIKRERTRGEMAELNEVLVDLNAWAAEVVDESAFFKGQPEPVQSSAKELALDVLTQMLRIKK